jgi:cytochrome P450
MDLMPRLSPVALRGPRAVPLLGPTGNVLGFFRDPIGTMLTLKREFGDVVPLADKNPAWVALFGAKDTQAVLQDQNLFHNFADIPIKVPPGSAPLRLNNALTSQNGDVHRRARRMMMPAFAKPAIAGYRDDMVAMAEKILAGWQVGDVVDVARAGTELAMSVAMQCLYGVDLSKQTDTLGTLSMRYLEGLLSVGALMFPVRLPGTPYARFMDTAEALEARIRTMITERRGNAAGRRDVLSLLVSARDEDGSTMSEEELIGQAAVLFIAGHETTANTLAWTLFLLSQHPAVLAALEDELDGALKGAPPTVDDLKSLALLDRVVKESMRIFPAAAILFFRRATADVELGGAKFPANSTFLLSSAMAHRDERVFTDPLRFKPERWETVSPGPYEYLPFGAGPRRCIGAPFAEQALRVLLAMLLQRFRFELLPGQKLDRIVRGITLGMKQPLRMRLARRDRAPLAPVPVTGDVHELVTL